MRKESTHWHLEGGRSTFPKIMSRSSCKSSPSLVFPFPLASTTVDGAEYSLNPSSDRFEMVTEGAGEDFRRNFWCEDDAFGATFLKGLWMSIQGVRQGLIIAHLSNRGPVRSRRSGGCLGLFLLAHRRDSDIPLEVSKGG